MHDDVLTLFLDVQRCLNVLGKDQYLFSSEAYTDLNLKLARLLDARDRDGRADDAPSGDAGTDDAGWDAGEGDGDPRPEQESLCGGAVDERQSRHVADVVYGSVVVDGVRQVMRADDVAAWKAGYEAGMQGQEGAIEQYWRGRAERAESMVGAMREVPGARLALVGWLEQERCKARDGVSIKEGG